MIAEQTVIVRAPLAAARLKHLWPGVAMLFLES